MIRYYVVLIVSLFTNCKQVPSQVVTSEDLTKNQVFWQTKQTEEKKDKEQKLFPKKTDSLNTVEYRRNRVYIHSANCQYEVFVNDVLSSRFMGDIAKSGGTTGATPINQHVLFSSVNEIKIRMYPKYGDTNLGQRSYFKMEFFYFINDLNSRIYNKEMGGESGINIDNSDTDYEGEPRTKYNPPHKLEGLPVYEWRTTFEASVPFEIEGWLKSVNLKEEQEEKKLKNELLLAYKELFKIIEKRDVSAYLEAVKLRKERIKTAFYLTKEEEKRNAEFINLLEDKNYELLPITEEAIVLEYQGYGKLAILSDVRDGEGIIRLRNKKDEDEEVTLDFRFHRKEKGDPLSVI